MNVVSSESEPTRDACAGGVGRSDTFADRVSMPSPGPPTSVRYVPNVSDVNFSDSSAEMREVSLDEEKSVDEIVHQFAHKNGTCGYGMVSAEEWCMH